jgi:hypothetical protein
MPPKMAHKWLGQYDILDPEDEKDLETRASISEFHDSLPRHEAEEKAHKDYKRDKVIEAASHHLRGLKSAHAIGDIETAKKHGTMFALALKELKHEDPLNPPDEVKDRASNSGETFHHFKAHKGDYYTLPKEAEAEGEAKSDSV